MKIKLPKFEGRDVEAAELKVSGATEDRVGAMAQEEVFYLVVKGVVAGVNHQYRKDVYTRCHKGTVVAMVPLQEAQGARLLDEAQMMADEAFGVQNLFSGQDPPDGAEGGAGGKK